MKSLRTCLILLSFLIGILSLTSAVSAQKTFYWENFDVDIIVRENGDLDVTETQTLNFSGGTFTFGYRNILNVRLDNITDVSVREGDRVYNESSFGDPYTFTVKESNAETRIDWYFPETRGLNTYTFSYRVKGAIRTEEIGDQVFWMALPTDLLARVENSTITISLPNGISAESTQALINGNTSTSINEEISPDGRRVTYIVNNTIFPGDTVEVGARWPTGQLPIEVPDWQQQEAVNDTLGLIFLAFSALLTIAGPIGVLGLWYTRGRDPDVGITPDWIAEPPSTLEPALAGTLIDEKADMTDILSTLVDLARRGYLTMTETKSDFVYTHTGKSFDDLREYEQMMMRGIFNRKKTTKLSDLKYKFSHRLPVIREELYDEMTELKFFNRSPESIRRAYLFLGFAILAIAVLTAIVVNGAFSGVATAICVGIALVPAALAMLYTSTHMPRKTHDGAEEAIKWNAFYAYLKDIEKYTDLEEATDQFEKYLPYAVAFGIERNFIQKFSRIPTTPTPRWYGPYYPRRGYYGGYGRGFGRGQSSRRTVPSGESGERRGMGNAPSLDSMGEGLGGGLTAMAGGFTRMLNSSSTVMRSVKPPESSGGGFSGGGGGFSGGFSGGSSGGGGGGFG